MRVCVRYRWLHTCIRAAKLPLLLGEIWRLFFLEIFLEISISLLALIFFALKVVLLSQRSFAVVVVVVEQHSKNENVLCQVYRC